LSGCDVVDNTVNKAIINEQVVLFLFIILLFSCK
jgi:hypothetical protein